MDDPEYELDAFHDLIVALFATGSTGEVEPLVMRFRKTVASTQGGTVGFCFAEFNSLLWCARIHEVISLYSRACLHQIVYATVFFKSHRLHVSLYLGVPFSC